MDFSIITLGCKVNQYESERMRELLVKAGYSYSESPSGSDICIINSCTVTATGDSKCRKYIRRARRENPAAVIILCGCMPQAFPDDYSLFDECDIVIGNTDRNKIVDYLEAYLSDRSRIISIPKHKKGEAFEPMTVGGFSQRTRAYIKIEDGCNRFCSYCVIPYARGRVRSKPLAELEKEACELALAGYKEIVLVGINLSAYGEDIGLSLIDAVRAACSPEGISRVRLGSIEPERLDPQTLSLLSNEKKFCPHFHLSLQSGCDETLKRMRRHYTSAEYAKIVSDIRSVFDDPSITTDIMVGFVGESEEEFAASLRFCESVGFAKAHIFPYSRRTGTAADKMDGHIDERIKPIRAQRMSESMRASQQEFMLSQVGKVCSVLFETKDNNGMYEGYSENYTKIKVDSNDDLSGAVFDVRITKAYDDHCVGELLS